MAVAQVISLSELLQEVGISEQQLEARVSYEHLNQISLFLTSWNTLAPFLGLDQSDVEVIEEDGRGEKGKRLKMLQIWKDKNAFKATYRKLVDALLSLGMAGHAEEVCRLLQPEATSNEKSMVVSQAAVASTRACVQILKQKWAKLLWTVCRKLSQENKVDIEDVYFYICTQISIELPDTCSSTFYKIFLVLQSNKLLDFWNCGLLWNIVNEYLPHDEELPQLMKEYQSELEHFKKSTKVISFIAIISSELSPDVSDFDAPRIRREDHYQPYTFEMDADPHEATLMDVERSWEVQINQYSLPDLRKGLLQLIALSSILVTYLIPAKMASAVVKRVQACVGKFFTEQKILSITVGGERVYSGAKFSVEWRRGADAPEEISGALAVVMGERVYVKGWSEKVFQYDWRRDTWSTLPNCPVRNFGMTEFLGELITVGGRDWQFSVTGKVYQFNGQQWKEFLPPMPTARSALTIATRTSSSPKPPAIAACGGEDAHYQLVNTVEVYSHASSQWHTAKPLPIPCSSMTSVTINDTCYLLGGRNSPFSGTKCCFSVSLDSLIDNTTSLHSHLDGSIWISVSDTPLIWSTAASLRGSLIAIGGVDTSTTMTSSAIHIASDGSWERVRGGDLPEPCYMSASVCLPSGELLVAGGFDNTFEVPMGRTIFIASIID